MSNNFSSFVTDPLVYHCSKSKAPKLIFISVAIVKPMFILPLSTFILHMGYQRWQQHRSFNKASHSDVFAYHLAAMEMFWIVGIICHFSGVYSNSLALILAGVSFFSETFYAEMFFHLLTCVERYLAVLHPITYRGLRNARGVKIRNICIGCVWLLSFLLLVPHTNPTGENAIKSMLFFLVFCIIVISFCSFSVLCTLIHPGPGEGGGEKERVDQLKQRAFYTTVVISTALWLWFISLFVAVTMSQSPLLSESAGCVLTTSVGYLNLPSSLVSPLLFLHRAGKLTCGCFKCD